MPYTFTADDFEQEEAQNPNPSEEQHQEDPNVVAPGSDDDLEGDPFPRDAGDDQEDVDAPVGGSGLDMVLSGDDIPEELRGKTMREAMQTYNGIKNFAQGLTARQMQQQQVAPAPAPAQEPVSFTEEDFLGADPQVFQQKLDQFFAQRTQPMLVEYYTGQAQMQYQNAKNNPRMKYFKDYEGEILQMAQQLPVNQVANPSTWEGLYSIVVQRHLDEIIQKEASRPKPRVPVTERGTGAGTGRKTRTPQLTAQERKVADALGISHDQYARLQKNMFSEER